MSRAEGLTTDLKINGKRVILRDELPARDSWEVLELLRKGSEASFDDEVRLLSTAVLSWEFEGDPSTPEPYANLNLFPEFLPLRDQVRGHLYGLLAPPDGLGKATYRALTQGWPMPWAAIKWMLIFKTGWTLDYVESLNLEDIMEGFAVQSGLNAARNA